MRVIRASAAEVKRAWLDTELTLPEACALVGMSKDALQARAAALKLAPRRAGRREVIRPHHEREFRLMWKAGVAAREIGRHFGCSYFAVVNTAARLALTMRGAGYRPRMTLAAYQEAKAGVALQIAAMYERAAMAEARQ